MQTPAGKKVARIKEKCNDANVEILFI